MSSPVLFLLGASHHKTPLELREKLALSPERLPAFHQAAAALPGMREIAVLNTCNRVEFYGTAESGDTVHRLRETFCAFQDFPADAFATISHQAGGLPAIEHLLTVASGLDSQMLGETEILGQVKDAYADAQTRGTTGPVLNRVFQKAFQHAKYVRTHTAINAGHISVANVAVDLALKIFGDLASTRILLLGAGDIGEKTAKAFQSSCAGSLTVASRTLGRAMELATTLNATALPWEHMTTHLGEYSIVVGSTAAPDVVVTLADAAAAIKKRPADPLFFIDLALPRDIDAAVAKLDNVFLYNLDDLAKIAEANLAARTGEVVQARKIVSEKSAALWKQIESQAGGSLE
ncbi:glutamyl-tRNA reductase [Rariglobus hedericola]|uniref:Glutamyl-tRNA reductase n=1 Tax=Rariglobus hedericola TaxID=2597822 RepID=A0A556QMB9_9BACT|nr:glutamyl-tRNA reductase [Rariglobus hedericola]TSJ77765.1 glutamyl-tRNA reductase [Rariglobus hedericola]